MAFEKPSSNSSFHSFRYEKMGSSFQKGHNISLVSAKSFYLVNVLYLGPHPLCSGLPPGSAFRDQFRKSSRDHIESGNQSQ